MILQIIYLALCFFLLWKTFCKSEKKATTGTATKTYVQKVHGLPYFGIGLELIGCSCEVIFNKLVNYVSLYNGRIRANAAHHKWIGVAIPEDIELIVNDPRFFEKSDEYRMSKSWLQDGLLTVGNRKKWHNRRKVLTPGFHFSILEFFVQVFDRQADILLRKLEKYAGICESFDICNYVNLYALDVICETSMGVTIHAQTDKESEYVNSIKE